MLKWVEHEKSFITAGPELWTIPPLVTSERILNYNSGLTSCYGLEDVIIVVSIPSVKLLRVIGSFKAEVFLNNLI